MKLNINKITFIVLTCIGIGFGCVTASISLLTSNHVLSGLLLAITYLLGIKLVDVRRKYPLLIKKTN